MTPLDTPAIANLLRQTLAEGQEPFVIITSDSMAPSSAPATRRGSKRSPGSRSIRATSYWWKPPPICSRIACAKL